MARLPRAVDEGLIYRAFNRGNNRADVFAEEGAHEAFPQINQSLRSIVSAESFKRPRVRVRKSERSMDEN